MGPEIGYLRSWFPDLISFPWNPHIHIKYEIHSWKYLVTNYYWGVVTDQKRLSVAIAIGKSKAEQRHSFGYGRLLNIH